MREFVRGEGSGVEAALVPTTSSCVGVMIMVVSKDQAYYSPQYRCYNPPKP